MVLSFICDSYRFNPALQCLCFSLVFILYKYYVSSSYAFLRWLIHIVG